MATSVTPWRHVRPKVSDTMTPTSAPVAARRPSRIRRADRSESSGSSAAQPDFDVGEVHARVGADETVTCLGDEQVAAAAQHPDRLRLHQPDAVVGVVGVDLDQPTLGLGHDLLGDDDHVAVGRARRAGR